MSELNPRERTILRVKCRTEYDFVLERNAIDPDGGPTRSDVRKALQRLTHSERKALDARLRRNLNEVRALMLGDPKQFDEPHIQVSDLQAETRFDTV